MTDEEEMQRAIRDAIFAEDPADSAAPARVAIYRRLVRNTLSDVVEKIIPRTRAKMGAPFDDAFARFLAERGPRTHHLRDVPRELVEWASPRWKDDARVAPWLVDLARHELAWFGAASAPDVESAPTATDIALDQALLVSSLARVERYAYAVHEDFFDEGPTRRDVAVLYFRDERHDVITMEIDALSAELLARADLPLKDAIAGACDAIGVAMNDDVLARVARFLADLGARGVLLGAQRPKTRS